MTGTLVHRGKVREVHDAGPGLLRLVATDRVSAFDVVMAEPVPDKGRVLTSLSAFWFARLAAVAPNHLVEVEPDGRTMLVRRAEMVPFEFVVRGHLAGSAWAEYRRSGAVGEVALPEGLEEGAALPEPLLTPTTKAAPGGHDEPVAYADVASRLGAGVAERARAVSLAAYREGARLAAERGIVVADTKFELGWVDGELALCDEVLTPDSSRFWTAGFAPGTPPESFDKQPLRDWLAATGWDKRPPPPPLPPEVVEATRRRYLAAHEKLTGRPLAALADRTARPPAGGSAAGSA